MRFLVLDREVFLYTAPQSLRRQVTCCTSLRPLRHTIPCTWRCIWLYLYIWNRGFPSRTPVHRAGYPPGRSCTPRSFCLYRRTTSNSLRKRLRLRPIGWNDRSCDCHLETYLWSPLWWIGSPRRNCGGGVKCPPCSPSSASGVRHPAWPGSDLKSVRILIFYRKVRIQHRCFKKCYFFPSQTSTYHSYLWYCKKYQNFYLYRALLKST